MRNLPIRVKLQASFMLAISMASVILIIRMIYEQNKSETAEIAGAIANYKSLALQSFKAQQDFLHIDLTNDQYFITETSKHRDEHNRCQVKMSQLIEEVQKLPVSSALGIEEMLDNLVDAQKRAGNTFEKLSVASQLVGFKDFGITGEMRDFAHQLEDSFPEVLRPEMLLMLRRHEKDFIIRKEESYAEKFFKLHQKISEEMTAKLGSIQSQRAKVILDQYAEAFGKLYQHNKRIGLTSVSGLRGELVESESHLLQGAEDVLSSINERSKTVLLRLQIYFWIAISACLGVIILLVNYLARLLARPLVHLSGHLDHFVSSKFEANISVEKFENRKDEFGGLYQNFKKLAQEITVSFKNYRIAAEQKQLEILEKNEQIEKQHSQMEQQKNMLAIKNLAMIDSIRYAQRLQAAIFPGEERIKELLGPYTLLFKPKDIVSGDFYWVDETPDSIYWAVADCTGHGVPGAFMSILGYTFLKQAVEDLDLRETHDILDYINSGISELLNRNFEDGQIKDGMDIALCRYIKSEGVIQFSGANRPLCLVRDGEVIIFKSDRLPVGWYFEHTRAPFTSRKVQIEDTDLIYLFSDGYYDQFGGGQDKKLKFHSFKSILSELHPTDHGLNDRLLQTNLSRWQGLTEQVDDICVLGIGGRSLRAKNSVKHLSNNPVNNDPFDNETKPLKIFGGVR